jgi:hypothetical protein
MTLYHGWKYAESSFETFFRRVMPRRHTTTQRLRRRMGVESLEARRLLAITLEPIGTYETGVFDESAAEIVTYDPDTQQLFVVNSDADAVDVLDISDPTNPTLTNQLDVSAFGSSLTSVTLHDGLVAVSIIGKRVTQRGTVAFFETGGDFIGTVKVGRNPDMVTFTPDGAKVLVANEGPPDDNYKNDPEGSVTIIDASNILADGIPEDPGSLVTTARFNKFNSQADDLRAAGVRIFGPNATVAQDLEPEYIAVSPDSSTAWVTLQENNAIAKLDIATGGNDACLLFENLGKLGSETARYCDNTNWLGPGRCAVVRRAATCGEEQGDRLATTKETAA